MRSLGYCRCRPASETARQYSTACRVRQTGVALITVLLIVFIASIAAVSLATLQQRSIRRSTVFMHQQQARLYTLGVEQWAMIVLARDRQKSETDSSGEEWANLPPVLPVEGGGVITARIRDLQGCFNLNNLWRPASGESLSSPDADQQETPTDGDEQGKASAADSTEERSDAVPKKAASNSPAATQANQSAAKAELDKTQIKRLQKLLELIELKPELAQAIADWIDPDADLQFPDGAEDSDYTALDPPYLAANRSFISVSELRFVKGFDREAYDRLAPYVCALPSGVPLNVNTAQAPVLAALGEDIALKDVENLLENRPQTGYKNVDEFLNAAKLTVNAQVKAQLSVASQYFLVRTEARVGDGRAVLHSTLYRDEEGVHVLQRNFGNQD